MRASMVRLNWKDVLWNMATSRVLVYGGRGALGSAVVDFFKSKSWVRLPGQSRTSIYLTHRSCTLKTELSDLHMEFCILFQY